MVANIEDHEVESVLIRRHNKNDTEKINPNGNLLDKTQQHKTDIIKDEVKNSKKVTSIIFLSLLLDLLAFTMILPLFPTLLDYYDKAESGGNTFYTVLLRSVHNFQKLTGAPDRFVSVLFGGVLGSLYSFLQFVASPILGSLSDRYGRKPALFVCLIGIALSHGIWRYASTFSLFVLARVVGGLSKANVSISMAVVADVSTERTRARGMALVGLAFSIGFIAGPLAGAWFALNSAGSTSGQWGETPALCALALSCANIVLVTFCLPETLPKEKRSKTLALSLSKAISFVSPIHLINFQVVDQLTESQRRTLSKIGQIYFGYLFLYAGLEFTLTFLTHHVFGYTALQQGKMFFVIGVIMAILQGGAARRLSAASAVRAARGALILTPVSFVCVGLAGLNYTVVLQPIHWLWAGLVLFAVSTAFAVSCITSVAAGLAQEASRGAVLGCLRSLGALARAAGPLVASTVYWYCGAPPTYFAGAVMLIMPALMLLRLKIK